MIQRNTELKPMKIGDIIDYSIEIFKNNFKTFTFISLVLYIPWVFAKSMAGASVLKESVNLFSEYLESADDILSFFFADAAETDMHSVTLNLLNIVYSLTIKLVFHAAIMKIVYHYIVAGKDANFSYKNVFKTIRNSFKYMWRLAGYKLIFYIVLLGIGFLTLILTSLLLPAISISMAPIGIFLPEDLFFIFLNVVIWIVGPALVFLPVSFFWTRLVLGYNFIVNENLSVSESRRRAFHTSGGFYWHMCISSLFCYIIYFVVGKMLTTFTFFLFGVYGNNILFLYPLFFRRDFKFSFISFCCSVYNGFICKYEN